MRITRADATPYALPFTSEYVTARGRLERREMVLLELSSDEGPVGLGEAVPMSLRDGAGLRQVERELRERCAERLVGLEVGPGGVDPAPLAAGLSSPARAAIEMALIDLASVLDGVSAWRHLGADSAEPIECNATLAAGPPEAVARDAAAWLERGFRTFKLKVGMQGDVELVAAVRAAVGPEARIRVDANGAWSVAEATARLAEMERHGIELAEQPSADLDRLAAVRSETDVEIAADESVTGPEDARRAVELGACGLATVKLAKTGGIAPAREVAAELPVYMSSALDGPVGIAAAAHAAQAIRVDGHLAPIAHGLATQLLFADSIASSGCEVRDGFLYLEDRPGFGVEIDRSALARHGV
jgi:o-succinylbenzoate synthase